MRILFPVHGIGVGVGSEDYMMEVARGLADRGHEVTLLVPQDCQVPSGFSLSVLFYPAPPSPKPVLWRLWYPLSVSYQILSVARLKLPAYDVIMTGLLPAMCGLSLAMKATPRVYLALSPLACFEILSYGVPTINIRLGARVYHILQRWAWRRSNAVVSFTPTMSELRTRFLKGAPRQLIASAPGVDFAKFRSGERDQSLLAEFGIPDDAPIVISFCRLIESKDIAFLLRSFARPEIPTGAHLLVLGKGAEMERLRDLARGLGLSARTHFAGFRENVEDYLRLGHVYAFPSRLESFGLTLAQALATGLPAVARRNHFPHVITSSESMIEDGKTGFLVDDETAMARAVGSLLTDGRRRVEMGLAAAAAAREHFRWDRHLDDIERALLELAPR